MGKIGIGKIYISLDIGGNLLITPTKTCLVSFLVIWWKYLMWRWWWRTKFLKSCIVSLSETFIWDGKLERNSYFLTFFPIKVRLDDLLFSFIKY